MFENGLYYSEKEKRFSDLKIDDSFKFVCDLGEDINAMFFHECEVMFGFNPNDWPNYEYVLKTLSHFIQSNFELV